MEEEDRCSCGGPLVEWWCPGTGSYWDVCQDERDSRKEDLAAHAPPVSDWFHDLPNNGERERVFAIRKRYHALITRREGEQLRARIKAGLREPRSPYSWGG